MAKRRVWRLVLVLLALVIAVPGALTYSDYRRDIQFAWDRVSSGSLIANTPCGRIEYVVDGEGPPVLVVHGAGGGFDQGIEFGRALVERGFQVIAMSRFGYLRTPLPADASAAAQADAHACLLDALHIRRAAVVGASAGAPSSMQFALRHPDRCTALVILVPATYVPPAAGAPPAGSPPPGSQFLFDTALKSDFLFWAASKFARQAVIRTILATPPSVVEKASPDEQARVADVLDQILPISPRRTGLLNDEKVISSLKRYDLERITAPTLVISTEDDLYGTFASARYTADHIPQARFIGYRSGGHLWVGHGKEVADQIAEFLTRATAIANSDDTEAASPTP